MECMSLSRSFVPATGISKFFGICVCNLVCGRKTNSNPNDRAICSGDGYGALRGRAWPEHPAPCIVQDDQVYVGGKAVWGRAVMVSKGSIDFNKIYERRHFPQTGIDESHVQQMYCLKTLPKKSQRRYQCTITLMIGAVAFGQINKINFAGIRGLI